MLRLIGVLDKLAVSTGFHANSLVNCELEQFLSYMELYLSAAYQHTYCSTYYSTYALSGRTEGNSSYMYPTFPATIPSLLNSAPHPCDGLME